MSVNTCPRLGAGRRGQVTEVVTGNHMVPAPNTAPGSAHGGRVLCLLHAALWASEAE